MSTLNGESRSNNLDEDKLLLKFFGKDLFIEVDLRFVLFLLNHFIKEGQGTFNSTDFCNMYLWLKYPGSNFGFLVLRMFEVLYIHFI